MVKPKKQQRSKYRASVETEPKSGISLETRAKEFLSSGTPASYATQAVLVLVALSGIVMLAAMPGLTVVAGKYHRSRFYSKRQISNAVGSLKRGGYLEENIEKNGTPRVHLTKKGEAYFQKILFEDVQLPEPTQWGGKWTFVLFDIPIQFSKAREALRWRLKVLGFYQYQKSVWVYPHPCEKEILYVADYFGVGKFVEIMSVDSLSKDEELKKHFKLV